MVIGWYRNFEQGFFVCFEIGSYASDSLSSGLELLLSLPGPLKSWGCRQSLQSTPSNLIYPKKYKQLSVRFLSTASLCAVQAGLDFFSLGSVCASVFWSVGRAWQPLLLTGTLCSWTDHTYSWCEWVNEWMMRPSRNSQWWQASGSWLTFMSVISHLYPLSNFEISVKQTEHQLSMLWAKDQHMWYPAVQRMIFIAFHSHCLLYVLKLFGMI